MNKLIAVLAICVLALALLSVKKGQQQPGPTTPEKVSETETSVIATPVTNHETTVEYADFKVRPQIKL